MRYRILGLVWLLAGLAVGLLLFGALPRAHALPEYSTRTGEPCATCHVNPAGGGPRTARGVLWIAQRRPDIVPDAPGGDKSEDPAPGDGQALYGKLGCAGCHGSAGEGASGPALNESGAEVNAAGVIRQGKGTMMAYRADTLSDSDLDALVQYLRTLAAGSAEDDSPPPPVDPAAFVCADDSDGAALIRSCGGN